MLAVLRLVCLRAHSLVYRGDMRDALHIQNLIASRFALVASVALTQAIRPMYFSRIDHCEAALGTKAGRLRLRGERERERRW